MTRPLKDLPVLLLACLAGGGLTSCRSHVVPPTPPPPPQPSLRPVPRVSFIATAYSGGSRTASGTRPRPGVVAADPAVLPMGSRIHVQGAGPYSGLYVVRDTGGKVRGHTIDIYMPKYAQAKRFGRRPVTVEVVEYGNGHRNGAARYPKRPTRRHRKHRRHPTVLARVRQ